MTRAALTLAGYALIVVLALAGLNHALGFFPGSPQWRAKQAAVKVQNLEGQVSSLERTATGNAEIATATETYHTREVIYRDTTARAQTEARTAPDANTPLDDPWADRLHRADGLMCQSGPCATTRPPDAP